MSDFWFGFLCAVFCYFGFGFCMGLAIVGGNLARFHGGGFQWRRMIHHVGMVTLFWPGAIAEFVP